MVSTGLMDAVGGVVDGGPCPARGAPSRRPCTPPPSDLLRRGGGARRRAVHAMLRYVQKRERGTRVGRVDFGLLSAEEVRRMAVPEVCDLNIYQRGMPQVSGINDHRMGTVDRRLMCGTCGHDVRSCPGHTGYIALPLPCYHTGYLDQLLKVLRSVCFFCSRLTLADDEGPPRGAADAKAHFAAVYAAARLKRRCAHCQGPRPALSRTVTGLHVDWSRVDAADWGSPEERAAVEAAPFTPASALSVLTDVSDADAVRLGFTPCAAHPRDLVLCSVLVPPPISRPAIMASEGSRSRGQDDLTHRLQDINKRCIELRAWLAGRVDPMHAGGGWRDGALARRPPPRFTSLDSLEACCQPVEVVVQVAVAGEGGATADRSHLEPGPLVAAQHDGALVAADDALERRVADHAPADDPCDRVVGVCGGRPPPPRRRRWRRGGAPRPPRRRGRRAQGSRRSRRPSVHGCRASHGGRRRSVRARRVNRGGRRQAVGGRRVKRVSRGVARGRSGHAWHPGRLRGLGSLGPLGGRAAGRRRRR